MNRLALPCTSSPESQSTLSARKRKVSARKSSRKIVCKKELESIPNPNNLRLVAVHRPTRTIKVLPRKVILEGKRSDTPLRRLIEHRANSLSSSGTKKLTFCQSKQTIITANSNMLLPPMPGKASLPLGLRRQVFTQSVSHQTLPQPMKLRNPASLLSLKLETSFKSRMQNLLSTLSHQSLDPPSRKASPEQPQ